ncbi:MAG: FmdB family transcriptional regulator [Anaerolineaceae bacterium]|nr:FmdB family transcriptional regulator [Anaerolineaceae bacterium]
MYEYCCSNCRTRFDQLRTMANADEPIDCPDCSGHDATRVLSNFFSSSATHGASTANMMAGNGTGGGCCGGMCCGGHSPN